MRGTVLCHDPFVDWRAATWRPSEPACHVHWACLFRKPCSQMRAGARAVGFGLCAFSIVACNGPTSPESSPGSPPAISCPSPQTIQSLDGLPTSVAYGVAVTTGGTPPVTTTCAPQSGSTFPIGSTTVTCTAIDADHRASSCQFLVIVAPPPTLSLTRFVAFGDSLTWGEDGTQAASSSAFRTGTIHPAVQLQQSQTYPGALQQALIARYTQQSPTVANEGLPGEFVTGGAPSRLSSVLRDGHYDVLLLMEGSVDLSARNDTVQLAAIAGLRQMLADAKSRGVQPYLATVPPINPAGSRGIAASQVPSFNDQIRALAAADGVPLVDVYAALEGDVGTFIGSDGLHPTAAGYAKIADVFFTSIMKTLEVPT